MSKSDIKLKTSLFLLLLGYSMSCINNLEDFFLSQRKFSIEKSVEMFDIVLHVSTLDSASSYFSLSNNQKNTILFDLIDVYKSNSDLKVNENVDYFNRKINITFPLSINCNNLLNNVPNNYIIFSKHNQITNEINAMALVKWNKQTDERVWNSLGWSKWSDWSTCSVSCSFGIQQRTRYCHGNQVNCHGFNVQQRHCNLFSCNNTVSPLNFKGDAFFHPESNLWQRTPDRLTAWRLTKLSYISISAILLFSDITMEQHGEQWQFPLDLSLAITIRIFNSTLGSIINFRSYNRQQSYFSLEIDGDNYLKLIYATNNTMNGTDSIRIDVGRKLNDGLWHQIAISMKNDGVIDTFIDCQWLQMNILPNNFLEIPAKDCNVIVGYLFEGDLEQLSIILDTHSAELQCSTREVPIIDSDIKYTKDGFKLFAATHKTTSKLENINKEEK